MRTNADNLKRNQSAITKALANARKAHFEAMVDTLSAILEDAMQECLNLHDEEHPHHTDDTDTYGWALLYNGAVVNSSDTEMGGEFAFEGDSLFDEGRKGWLGVVGASMLPNRYFKWDYELGIFSMVTPYVKSKLDRLFARRR